MLHPAQCHPARTRHAGEPIRVKSKDLPLHWFDLLFRRTGAALAFCLCAARATVTLRLAAECGPATLRGVHVLRPAGIYALQTAVRGVIYWLHAAGGTPEGPSLGRGQIAALQGHVACSGC